MAAATSVWRSRRANSNWWWKNAHPMHRDRDGPSRITTRRSCDTTPSRAVIRTTISVRSPDLGCQGNDTRSPRLASVDKYLAIPKYQELSYKTIPEGSRQAPRDYFMLVEKQLDEMIRLSFHRRDQSVGNEAEEDCATKYSRGRYT